MVTNTNEELQALKKELRKVKLELINAREENELLKKLLLDKSPSLVNTLPEYNEEIDKELLLFLERSYKRVEILKVLDTGAKVPSMISKELKVKVGQVSHYLKVLKEKELVDCLNDEAKTYRFYALTPKGKKYLELIETTTY